MEAPGEEEKVMLSFFRDGFYKDFIVLIVLTIILGAVFSSGIAWALDSYFGDALDDMIGEYGEYDVILHIREESKDAAMRELERIAEQHFKGARLSQTLTIAGQANFFFGLPEECRTRDILENIASYFGGVPGLNGYTLIIEPSILIRGVHSGVRSELQEQIEAIPGVEFAFRDGSNMIVLLTDEEHSREVSAQVEEILAQYQIVELRFPMGFEVDTQQVGDEAINIIKKMAPGRRYSNVTSAEYGEELDAFLKTLVEMRDFLMSYASKVRITVDPNVHLAVGEQIAVQGTSAQELEPTASITDEHVLIEVTAVYGDMAEGMITRGSIAQSIDKLVQKGYGVQSDGVITDFVGEVELENERYRLAYAISESLRLLEELDELSVQANAAVDNADAVLNTFQEALMQLEVLQVQMRQLNDGIAKGGTGSTGEQLLVTLLLNGLFQSLAQAAVNAGEGSIDSLENLDIEEMRTSLNGISEQIANVQDIDVQAIIQQIEFVRDTLPNLEDEEIGQSIRLINTYLGGQVIPGERIQILVHDGSVDEKEIEKTLQVELDNPYLHTYSTSVGMVNPDARSEIFRILKEVRAIVAGMLAIIYTGVILVLDHATVFSTLKYIRAARKPVTNRWLRIFDPIKILGGSLGALILFTVYQLSRAQIPMVTPPMIALCGFVIGVLIAIFAERFSPVHTKEIMAGQALGLSNVQIMREIVIPAGRPGIMNLLNRWKQQF